MPELARPSGVPGSAVVYATTFVSRILTPEERKYLAWMMSNAAWLPADASAAIGGARLWDATIESDVTLVDLLTGHGFTEERAEFIAASFREEVVQTLVLKNQAILGYSVYVWAWPAGVDVRFAVYLEPEEWTTTEQTAETPVAPGAGPPPGGREEEAGPTGSGTIDSTESLDGQGGVKSEGGRPYEATDEEDEEYEEQQKSHEEAKEDEPTEEEPDEGSDIYWENEANLLRTAAVDYEFLTMWPTSYSVEIQLVTTYRTVFAAHY